MCDGVARCFEPVTDAHLRRLADLSMSRFEELFINRPYGAGRYQDRVLMLALCQGAAQHRLDGLHGVKDLDVWGFFRPHPGGPFPVRWRGTRDFGPSALGYHPDDAGYAGRRVDVLGRSINIEEHESPVEAIRRYLAGGHPQTAQHLAQRPVIALHPPTMFGMQVWPVGP